MNEEQGLTGANGLQPGFVTGDILLNLDSEEHGQLVIGCAGGKVTICRVPYALEAAPKGLKWYELHLDHFKGGHSGMEIGLGRGNANQQMARFIWEESKKRALALASIDGGGLANAIPRECKAVVGVDPACAAEFEKDVKEFSDMLHAEFLLAEEPSFIFEGKEAAEPEKVIDSATARKLISAVFACPNGVQGMSRAVEGLIETSDNVASVKMKENVIEVTKASAFVGG